MWNGYQDHGAAAAVPDLRLQRTAVVKTPGEETMHDLEKDKDRVVPLAKELADKWERGWPAQQPRRPPPGGLNL